MTSRQTRPRKPLSCRYGQSEGDGTGLKLRPLGIEKNIGGLQTRYLGLNFGHLASDQGRALRAIDGITALGRKNLADGRKGKTHILGILNERQIIHGLIAVAAVVVSLSPGRDKPELFVIAQLTHPDISRALQNTGRYIEKCLI